MYIQTEQTPNPNSLKFIPEKKVSLGGPIEIKKEDKAESYLLRDILDLDGVESVFLSDDYLSVNKSEDKNWNDLQHIIISLINEFYQDGNEFILNSQKRKPMDENLQDIEKRIIKVLETKVRPAVSRDGGDIKFKDFKNGVVIVELKGSCSGCPSSTITLKKGVQNLLCHYIPEVKQVEAV